MHFVFDGGVLADDTPIRLQESELDDYRFVDPDDLARYLPPVISTRVAAGLRGRGSGVTVYLPWTGDEPGLSGSARRCRRSARRAERTSSWSEQGGGGGGDGVHRVCRTPRRCARRACGNR